MSYLNERSDIILVTDPVQILRGGIETLLESKVQGYIKQD